MAAPAQVAPHVLVVDDDRAFRHVIASLLQKAGYTTDQTGDGADALARLRGVHVDLMLLDISLPGLNGLEVLHEVRRTAMAPRVVMLTADDTPDTLLQAMRGQADRFVRKPVSPGRVIDVVKEVLATSPATTLPIQVVSARPEWVELVAPCSLDVADRIQEFMLHLDADLPEDVRESMGQAFRELLTNAIEWGGRLDPSQQVRISCLRTRRLRLYRIADPGDGFDIDQLAHAAVSNPADDPLEHARVREERGLRPGGLGLLMSKALVDEVIYNQKRNEVVLVKYLD
jgi:CheY-like chemotaxis protein/anti-sigma regulatory factor (Ser/Thr protein kinase)